MLGLTICGGEVGSFRLVVLLGGTLCAAQRHGVSFGGVPWLQAKSESDGDRSSPPEDREPLDSPLGGDTRRRRSSGDVGSTLEPRGESRCPGETGSFLSSAETDEGNLRAPQEEDRE